MAPPTFSRRYYQNLWQYWRDLRYLLARPVQIHRALHNDLSHAFRERLMMVVTEVNQCRYCRSFHTSLSAKAGIEPPELADFSAGTVSDNTPEEQQMALRYAIRWAENMATLDTVSYRTLQSSYGEPVANAIDLALRMIWIGNLSGNTFDYWLYRLSFGYLK